MEVNSDGRKPLHTNYVPRACAVDKAFCAFASRLARSPRIANTLRRFESDGSFIGAYICVNLSAIPDSVALGRPGISVVNSFLVAALPRCACYVIPWQRCCARRGT